GEIHSTTTSCLGLDSGIAAAQTTFRTVPAPEGLEHAQSCENATSRSIIPWVLTPGATPADRKPSVTRRLTTVGIVCPKNTGSPAAARDARRVGGQCRAARGL